MAAEAFYFSKIYNGKRNAKYIDLQNPNSIVIRPIRTTPRTHLLTQGPKIGALGKLNIEFSRACALTYKNRSSSAF